MRYFHLFILVLTLISTSCKLTKEPNEPKGLAEDLPNIVYLLADDLGYGDLSSLNPESAIATPNMDGIVKEGIHLLFALPKNK